MHIKNISQILNFKGEKSEITKGSIVNAKVISLLDNKGVVRLPNGSILPCIFLFKEGIEENTNYKFRVKEFHAQEILLEVLKDSGKQAKNTNIDSILEKLNISKSQGEEIISKLIKFNIPAKDETILDINKNYNFLRDLTSLNDKELLDIIKNLTGKTLTENSKEFQSIKSILNNFKNINLDFLTFLKENNIPPTLNNILKVNDFIKNPFTLNNFITNIENNIQENLINFNRILNNSSDLDKIELTIKNNTGYTVSKDVIQKTLLALSKNPQLANKLNLSSEKDFLSICREITKNPLLNEKSSEFIVLKELVSGNLNKDGSTFNNALNLDKIALNIKNNTGFTVNKDVIQKTLLALSENPQLTNKLNLSSEKDFLSICREITKNPLLNEKSSEFIVLKELASGNLNKLINIKQENTNPIEKMLLNSLNITQSSKDSAELKFSSINSILNNIKDFPESISKLPFQFLNSVMENVDINKYMYNNYSILNFNFKLSDNLYKNNIIIKNKYSNGYIDINDVKIYISVENEKIGLVEGCVSKNFKTININLNVNKKYINDFIKTINILKNNLSNIGYSDCNIKIDSLNEKLDILSLSNFFNDDTYFDLDVKV